MPFSFNILQGKDCFTLSTETLEYIIKITKNKNPKPSNRLLSKVPSCLQTARQSKNDKLTQMSSDSVQQTLKSNFSHFEILDFSFCQQHAAMARVQHRQNISHQSQLKSKCNCCKNNPKYKSSPLDQSLSCQFARVIPAFCFWF